MFSWFKPLESIIKAHSHAHTINVSSSLLNLRKCGSQCWKCCKDGIRGRGATCAGCETGRLQTTSSKQNSKYYYFISGSMNIYCSMIQIMESLFLIKGSGAAGFTEVGWQMTAIHEQCIKLPHIITHYCYTLLHITRSYWVFGANTVHWICINIILLHICLLCSPIIFSMYNAISWNPQLIHKYITFIDSNTAFETTMKLRLNYM